MEETIGRIGPYCIIRPLGGAGSSVFLARHQHLRETCALRILAPALTSGQLAELRQQVDRLARLKHPHLLRIYAVGSQAGVGGYLVAQRVNSNGTTLRELLRSGPLSPFAAARCIQQAASAVAALHEAGLVHGELRPSQVLLRSNSQAVLRGQVRVPPRGTSPTDSGPSRADDVFALGALLYEALVGDPPPPPPRQASRVFPYLPSPTSRRRRNDRGTLEALDPQLDAICRRALERVPDAAYPGAAALDQDLSRYLAGIGVEARAPSPGRRLRAAVGRHPRALAGAALLSAVLLSAAWSPPPSAPSQDSARRAGVRDWQRVRRLPTPAMASLLDHWRRLQGDPRAEAARERRELRACIAGRLSDLQDALEASVARWARSGCPRPSQDAQLLRDAAFAEREAALAGEFPPAVKLARYARELSQLLQEGTVAREVPRIPGCTLLGRALPPAGEVGAPPFGVVVRDGAPHLRAARAYGPDELLASRRLPAPRSAPVQLSGVPRTRAVVIEAPGLEPFALETCEVSRGRFHAWLQRGGSSRAGVLGVRPGRPARSGAPRRRAPSLADALLPMGGVSLAEALAFARSRPGGRLPRVAEWQAAAGLWGTLRPGLDPAAGAWEAPRRTERVDAADRSALGCYDLAGNLREWGAEGKALGGSYLVGFRPQLISGPPGAGRAPDLGFRCAYTLPSRESP